jgi:hypothetical protein
MAIVFLVTPFGQKLSLFVATGDTIELDSEFQNEKPTGGQLMFLRKKELVTLADRAGLKTDKLDMKGIIDMLLDGDNWSQVVQGDFLEMEEYQPAGDFDDLKKAELLQLAGKRKIVKTVGGLSINTKTTKDTLIEALEDDAAKFAQSKSKVKFVATVSAQLTMPDGSKKLDEANYMFSSIETVSQLKEKVCADRGIPSFNIRLMVGGKPMDAYRRVVEYHIEDKALNILLCIYGLQGGAKKLQTIKVTKADRMLLGKTKASSTYSTVPAFNIPQDVAKRPTRSTRS